MSKGDEASYKAKIKPKEEGYYMVYALIIFLPIVVKHLRYTARVRCILRTEPQHEQYIFGNNSTGGLLTIMTITSSSAGIAPECFRIGDEQVWVTELQTNLSQNS